MAFLLLSILLSALPLTRAEAPKTPEFIVHTIEGKSVQGPLDEIAADWSIRLGGKPGAKIAGADLLSLRRVGVPLPPPPGDDHLILTNGDRVPFKTLRLDGERLVFRQPQLTQANDAAISLGLVTLIWLTPPANIDSSEVFQREFLAAKRKKDLVLLRNGDTIEGVLNTFEADRLEVEVDKKIIAIKRSQISLVALSTELAEKPKLKGTQARLILSDNGSANGTRLTLAGAVCTDGKTLVGTTAWGVTIQIPLEHVAALDWLSPRVISLSDLEPKGYEFTPFLGAKGLRWPLGKDCTADRLDLHVGGSTYDRGLSMHSQSRVVYNLPDGCRRFEALVGLDDRRGRLGSARIEILVDGKAVDLGWKGDLTLSKGPMPVSIPLQNAKTLTLVVDYGSRGDVQGLVNWVDMRLIKTAPKK